MCGHTSLNFKFQVTKCLFFYFFSNITKKHEQAGSTYHRRTTLDVAREGVIITGLTISVD